jgi:menaquinone-specific isochorismate synthase
VIELYWSDRDGKTIEKNARFSTISFDGVKVDYPYKLITDLPEPSCYKVISQTYQPDFDSWNQTFEKLKSKLNSKQLQKVVLARAIKLELEETPDPFKITSYLKKNAKNSFVFCIKDKNFAFIGATPERLFRREKTLFLSEAVAGTKPRGKTFEEDLMLEKQLLESKKDLLEFTPVKQYIQNCLSPFVIDSKWSENSILKTSHVQHLYSIFEAQLKSNFASDTILKSLHPTPALCGTPSNLAKSFLMENETFSRGLYCGAIGWHIDDCEEWIVGIRSCLVEKNRVTLFSAAGIIEESNVLDEWQELNQKIRLYDGVFHY